MNIETERDWYEDPDYCWSARATVNGNDYVALSYSEEDAIRKLKEQIEKDNFKEDYSAGLKEQPSPEADLSDKSGMNDKAIRYIAWGLGSLFIMGLLLINDQSFSRYGFFANEIRKTIAFGTLKDFTGLFTYYGSSDWAYFLWHTSLAGGIFMSWKLRFKTGKALGKIINKIHDKA